MGGGNLLSTAEDLVRFGNAFVRPGFLPEEAFEMLYTPQHRAAAQTTWGFGWFVGENEAGGRRLSISGDNPGLQAGLIVYPEQDLVVAVLSNALGIGSRDAELVNFSRFARRCMGWPDPPEEE